MKKVERLSGWAVLLDSIAGSMIAVRAVSSKLGAKARSPAASARASSPVAVGGENAGAFGVAIASDAGGEVLFGEGDGGGPSEVGGSDGGLLGGGYGGFGYSVTQDAQQGSLGVT